MARNSLDEKWKWFADARYGMFIHWGPYALYGRGEQVLIREMIDQREYAARACQWNPARFDPKAWAAAAREAGMRYAVLTTRHHDGYCLWDTKQTDYSSVAQAPQRDFVREYVDAFRDAGLRVGLYYSWTDFRIPACFRGPVLEPVAWNRFRDYCHAQVGELLTHYGRIDEFWFDGTWPGTAEAWGSRELLAEMRRLQPNILINNRLGYSGESLAHIGMNFCAAADTTGNEEQVGGSAVSGDFGTPEHHITAEPRPWESCQVSTWRLWGYTHGERWRPADLLLDMLVDAAGKGGNLLLNVGPTADGELPAPFLDRIRPIGRWLSIHGEAIYGSQARADACESVTWGRLTQKGNTLFAIIRFWPAGGGELRIAGLNPAGVKQATLLTTGQPLGIRAEAFATVITGLPVESPSDLFPVVRLELTGEAESLPCFDKGLWRGNPRRFAPWAEQRGTSVWTDGKER